LKWISQFYSLIRLCYTEYASVFPTASEMNLIAFHIIGNGDTQIAATGGMPADIVGAAPSKSVAWREIKSAPTRGEEDGRHTSQTYQSSFYRDNLGGLDDFLLVILPFQILSDACAIPADDLKEGLPHLDALFGVRLLRRLGKRTDGNANTQQGQQGYPGFLEQSFHGFSLRCKKLKMAIGLGRNLSVRHLPEDWAQFHAFCMRPEVFTWRVRQSPPRPA
jgi:hypothetical protein